LRWNEKLRRTALNREELYGSGSKSVMITTQILAMHNVAPALETGMQETWEWTRKFVSTDTTPTCSGQVTLQHVLVELPAVSMFPIGARVVESLFPGVKRTWSIDEKQLNKTLTHAWAMLEPEGDDLPSNIVQLPEIINSAALPYHNCHGV
jgi:hypothetical protein